MLRKFSTVAGLGFAGVLVCASLFFTGCSRVPGNAAATVNGVVISKDDVANRIRVAAGISPQMVPSDTGSQEYQDLQRDVTEQMVAEELEQQEAKKRHITVAPEEIDTIVDQIIEDQYLGSIDKLRQDFDRRGLKDEDLRGEVLRRLLHQKILDSLRAEVPVNEAEIRAQYDANIDSYVYPEKRQVRQIVLTTEAAAMAASARLAAGEDFPTVAKQVSTDVRTRDNGGLVGLVPRTALSPAVGDVAFTMQSGAVSPPFKVDQGWYIVKVELVTPATNRTYDQVKGDLIKFASNQRLVERYKTFVEEVKATYDVAYADDYAPREKPAGTTTETQPSLS